MTPPVVHTPNNHFPKAQKSIPSISAVPKVHPAIGSKCRHVDIFSCQPHTNGPDFSLPQTEPLVPLRPPIPPPPIPGPSKPTDVREDFSKIKQPSNQVQIPTFLTSIEPYIRPIREEDVGFLEWHGDEVEPLVMPKLGRHYLEVWEEQDQGTIPFGTATTDALPESFAPPQPKWDPSTLADPDLLAEEKGHGPLTERVISALLPIDEYEWKGVKAAEDAMEGRPGGSGAAASKKERLNVEDLEKRVRDNMRYHGLLTEIVSL
jgi:transcriptional adapter 3